MDYSKLLQPFNSQYQNIEENSVHSVFECNDIFKLPTIDDVAICNPNERIKENCSADKERNKNIYWLADSSTYHDIFIVLEDGEIKKQQLTALNISSILKCRMDLNKLLQLKLENKNEFEKITKDININGKEHFLTFGECPQKEATKEESIELENLFNCGRILQPLKSTNKWFTINGNNNLNKNKFEPKCLPEFELNGKKYVRVVYFNKKDEIEIKWQKVAQIKWKITNWLDIEQCFTKTNDKQLGLNYIECISEKAVISNIPFHTELNDINNILWQNSIIRAYANSANLAELNRDINYLSTNNYNFKNNGFLNNCINLDSKSYNSNYSIPNGKQTIGSFCFCGCVSLKQINIPSSVKSIENGAFDCLNDDIKIVFGENSNLAYFEESFDNAGFKKIYISKDAKHTIIAKKESVELEQNCLSMDFSYENLKIALNDNYRKNYILMLNLKNNEYIKFVPPLYTLKVFPNQCIQNYYVNRNYLRWQKLTKELGLFDLQWSLRDDALESLLKIYYAIGGFSKNQGESEKAYNFIVKAIFNNIEEYSNNTKYYIASELVNKYNNLKLNGEYNKEFAKFFIKNYKKNFMMFSSYDKYGNYTKKIDYLPIAHNNFNNILSVLPNKKTTGHDGRTLITPQILAKLCNVYTYDNENKNKELANAIRPYGYTQQDFDKMQQILEIAKQVKNLSTLRCPQDTTNNKIKFRFMQKDDVEAFTLGDKMNSCFKIGKLGEECLKDALTNPDAGIVVFENNTPTGKNIVAVSYIWYNKEEKLLCFDNIDIPLTQKVQLEKHYVEVDLTKDDLLESITCCAKAIVKEMNKTDNKIEKVTVGLGHSYFHDELMEHFTLIKNPTTAHNLYRGYSDARKEQVEVTIKL